MPLAWKTKPLIIQQDNARPHVKSDDVLMMKALNNCGWNMVIKNQPPNSPDFNVLDLGFFLAIQGIQQTLVRKDIK